jgi:hypothetical protein
MTLAEDRGRRAGHGIPLPRQAPWPRQSPAAPDAATALPVPALNVFEIREGLPTVTRGLPRRAEQGPAEHESISVAAAGSTRTMRGKPHPGRGHQTAGRATPQARRGVLKHLVQVRKRSV